MEREILDPMFTHVAGPKSRSHFQSGDPKVTYELIQQLEPAFPVAALCEALGVSRTAYYRYLSGQTYQPSEHKQKQSKVVEDAFWNCKRRYGSRRLVVELEELNEPMGRHRIRSLLQQQGLKAIQPRSFVPRTTDSRHGKRVCDNLLLNQPLPLAPDRVWVGDMDLRQSQHLGPRIYP